MTEEIPEPIPHGRYHGVIQGRTDPTYSESAHGYYFAYRVKLIDFNNRSVFVTMFGSPATLSLLMHLDAELIGRTVEVDVRQRGKDDIVYNTACFVTEGAN